MQKAAVLIGIFSILYYAAIGVYTGGYGGSNLVWLLLGLFLFAAAAASRCGVLLPKPVLFVAGIVLAAGFLVFAAAECLILSQMNATAEDGLDYILVLGAKIRGDRVTRSLKYRLDAAYEYLVKNENTIVIVSGGQGADEVVSEASVMKAYLEQRGIDSNRIWMEDKSTNTAENLKFSRRLMKGENPSAAVVSNNFHIYRAMALGRRQGLSGIQGIAAKTDPYLLLNYMVREGMALVKDKVVGNI